MNDVGVVIPREVFPLLKQMVPRLHEEARKCRNSDYVEGASDLIHSIDIMINCRGEVNWRGRRVLRLMRSRCVNLMISEVNLNSDYLWTPANSHCLAGSLTLGQYDWIMNNESGILCRIQSVMMSLSRKIDEWGRVLTELSCLRKAGCELDKSDVVISSHLMEWLLGKAEQESLNELQKVIDGVRFKS